MMPSSADYSNGLQPTSETRSERRAPLGLGRLERAGGAQYPVLGIERPDDLQPDRQPGAGQPAGYAAGRLTGHVERIAEGRPVDPAGLGGRVVEVLADRQ